MEGHWQLVPYPRHVIGRGGPDFKGHALAQGAQAPDDEKAVRSAPLPEMVTMVGYP